MMSSQGWNYCHVENDNDYNIMYLTFYRLHEVKWVEFCPWNVTDVAGLLFEYAQLSSAVIGSTQASVITYVFSDINFEQGCSR